MKKKYRLLDRNLIRHFGKVEVEIEPSMGERFVRAGKATSKNRSGKMEYAPPEHKAVFQAPEDKTILDIKNGEYHYPGPNDKLFPQIEK